MSKSIVVKSPNGAPVKLRKHPSTTSATWWEISSGSEGFCFSESGAWSQVEVPDAKPENNTTRKAEKVDDGKSSTFSVINTILLILTGASVLFLIWETGLIQKLL